MVSAVLLLLVWCSLFAWLNETDLELFVFAVSVDGELLPQIFVKMLQRDKPIEMQLTSAKW